MSIPRRATEDEKESGASSGKASVDLVPEPTVTSMVESSGKTLDRLEPTNGYLY